MWDYISGEGKSTKHMAIERSNSAQMEEHPLPPFLPPNATILMLGSFPPQKKRWCMDFFYPNFINDMWRIMGLVFYEDKLYFVNTENKCFIKDKIIKFLQETGIALYDTATRVQRLQDNASDKFLKIENVTDIPNLLKHIPQCKAIATTGQKASEVLAELYHVEVPNVGRSVSIKEDDKSLEFYRMPSSSRAYPMRLEQKAEFYRNMFQHLNLINT